MPRLLDLRLLRIASLRYTIRAAQLHRACAPIGCAQWQDASVPNEVSVWESRIPCQLAGWFVSAAVDSNHPALSMSLPLFCPRLFGAFVVRRRLEVAARRPSDPKAPFRCSALSGSRSARRRRLGESSASRRRSGESPSAWRRDPKSFRRFRPVSTAESQLVPAVSTCPRGFDLFRRRSA